jgi:hypothetical protein
MRMAAGPCTPNGGCLDTTPGDPALALDVTTQPGLFLVAAGGVLTLSNINIRNLARRDDYAWSASQPYLSVGVGTGLWPTLLMAPNSTVSASWPAAAAAGGGQSLRALRTSPRKHAARPLASRRRAPSGCCRRRRCRHCRPHP